jgi:hypothetical protein
VLTHSAIYGVAIYGVVVIASISLNGQVYSTAQKKLAATIRSLREAKGVSQERFAQLANVERAQRPICVSGGAGCEAFRNPRRDRAHRLPARLGWS